MSQSAVAGKRLHASRTLPAREAWLLGLANALRPVYGGHTAALPARVRISVGWPSKSATTARTRRIGECWYSASDGVLQVFVSPLVADQLQVAAVLVHELVHAALGPGAGHGPAFRRVATRPGRSDACHPCLTRPGRHARSVRRSTWPLSPCGPGCRWGAEQDSRHPHAQAHLSDLRVYRPHHAQMARCWPAVCPDGDPLVEPTK